MKEYDVLYTTDNNYFIHMLTSIYSLIENNQDIFLNIHIIEDNLETMNKKRLYLLTEIYKNIRINIFSIKLIEKSMNKFDIPKWRNTNIANARLFANEIIKCNKLLYLDSDTAIVNSIKNVYDMDTSPLYAVKEIKIPMHLENQLNYYYNSGVMLFNFDEWENDHCIEKIYNILKTNTINLQFPDQDLINLAIENISTLPLNYNIFPIVKMMEKHPFLSKFFYTKNNSFYSKDEIKKAILNPIIYHNLDFLNIRPWDNNIIHPYNNIYRYYRKIFDDDYIPNKIEISNYEQIIKKITYLILKSLVDDKCYQKILNIYHKNKS